MSWSMDEDKEMDEMDTQDREKCPRCTHTFVTSAGGSASENLARHVEADHSRSRIRWTVTGEGVPAGTRKETWTALLDVVALAEHRGLRVEVTEVEEEDR